VLIRIEAEIVSQCNSNLQFLNINYQLLDV